MFKVGDYVKTEEGITFPIQYITNGVFIGNKNLVRNYTKEELTNVTWLPGDKLRHKNSFNSVIFKSYSKTSDYFHHEESNVPLMCKHYIKIGGDN